MPARSTNADEVPKSDEVEFFEAKIRPLLVKRCYACHSAQASSVESGLLLDSKTGVRQGGTRGPVIDPGQPDESLLLVAVRYTNEELQMPPADGGGRLSETEVADLVAWVRMGAPYPESGSPGENRSAMLEHARQHWAFQPIAAPSIPKVSRPEWVQTPVDAFILAQLDEHQLAPSEPANRRTLLRRAKYDLLGLPPTWEETEAFERDSSPDAYRRLIERYLASPHYGERWGRYWLDVARYADTKGYVYAREERRFVHSHVYRDWVVSALNRDMPYNEFLVRQIAADQLAEDDPASLAAMGFLTIGRRFINVIPDVIDDRIDVVCRGTMGLTVSCARCHDHKFDPIPTADYYSLYGVFHGSAEKLVLVSASSVNATAAHTFQKELEARQVALDDLFRAKREELFNQLRDNVGKYLAAVRDVATLPTVEFYMTMGPDEVNPVFVRQWHAYLVSTPHDHPVFAPWHRYMELATEDFSQQAPLVMPQLTELGIPLSGRVQREFSNQPLASLAEVAERYGRVFSETHTAWKDACEAAKKAGTPLPTALDDPDQEAIRQILYGAESPIYLPVNDPAEAEFFFAEEAREALGQAQARIDQWIREAEAAPGFSLSLADRQRQQNPRIFVRGNPKNLGDEVPRRFLELLSGPDREAFAHGSGRLELARAITHSDNPLTPRVLINRIWMHHFGQGLVRTPSDFGLRSEPPSHPELLDFLARRFIDEGWSIKQLHRSIMLSSAYQQSASDDRPEASQIDPENRLLWHMNVRRLDFEAMRDSMLFVAGRLDPQLGGRAIDLTSRPFPRRRTLYGYIDRLNLPVMYRSFDFPNPDAHSPQRYDTMVPQQALFLMNHPFVLEQARHLVRSTAFMAAANDRERLQMLYHRVFARSASEEEIELAQPLIHQPPPAESPASPWSYGSAAPGNEPGKLSFEPLPFFTQGTWHNGPQLPELKCDWSSLTAAGGNVGGPPGSTVTRRWTASRGGTLQIKGSVRHSSGDGDGIRARIVHSRLGEIAAWQLKNLTAEAELQGLPVQAGDTIDFVVDGREDLSKDEFHWAPALKLESPAEGEAKPMTIEWDAARDFAGPVDGPLSGWERYVHVLLQSNEFVFVE